LACPSCAAPTTSTRSPPRTGELAREGLQAIADAPPERRAALLEWAAFADFLAERLPMLEQDWKTHRKALRDAGELPGDPPG
jgi:hypothetical protein